MFIQSQYNILINKLGQDYFIYNSMTNALAKFDEETYHYLLHDPQSSHYFSDLLHQGFAVSDEINEFERYNAMRKSYIYGEPDILHYVIAPSLTCNAKCIYCFEKGTNNNCHSEIRESDLKDIYSFVGKQIKSHRNVKRVRITWFGGEPLLQVDFISELSRLLIGFCDENHIEYSAFVITNGILLDTKMINALEAARVDKLQVTIDGNEQFYTEYKGVKSEIFHRVLQNIKTASMIFKIDVRLNVSKENEQAIIDTAKTFMEENSGNHNILFYLGQLSDCDYENCHSMGDMEFEEFRERFVEEIHGYTQYRESLKLIRRLSFCATVRKDYCVIGPDKKLYRCEHEIGKENGIIGDIYNGFYRNQNDLQYLEMQFEDECKTCNMLPLCAGGCPTFRIIYGKKLNCDAVKKKMMYRLRTEISHF